MANAARPLSPHLQIYRWPLSMAMSILHRVTGGALGVGTLLFAWWLLAAAAGPSYFATASGFMGSFIGLLMLFGWTWAMLYHLMNGLRHLVWDVGYLMSIEGIRKSNLIVLIASTAATLLLWIAGLALR